MTALGKVMGAHLEHRGPDRRREALGKALSSELAYLGMISATVALYGLLALLSIAPGGVAGKMSTIQLSVQRNVFLKRVLDVLGFNTAGVFRLRVTFYLLVACIVICYLWAVFLLSRRHGKRLFSLLFVFLVINLILFFVPPLGSRDLFSYVFYGRISSVYHQNPYLATPQRFAFDPFFPLTSLYWKSTAVVYGPLFVLLSDLLTRLAGNGIAMNIYVFKLAAILCNLACVLLIWKILGRYAPRRQTLGTMLYAWNPLILVHSAGGAHNDVLMAMLALAALSLMMREKRYLGFFLLCLSFLVKYITAVFMVSYAVYLYRRTSRKAWLRDMGVFSLIFTLSFFAAYLPFWEGAKTLSPVIGNLGLRNVYLPAGWFLACTSFALRMVFDLPPEAASLAANVFCSVLLNLLFVVILYYISINCRSNKALPHAWSLVALSFLLTRTYFLPWYLFWLFPFLCLRRWDHFSRGCLFAGTLTIVFADLVP